MGPGLPTPHIGADRARIPMPQPRRIPEHTLRTAIRWWVTDHRQGDDPLPHGAAGRTGREIRSRSA